MAFSWFELLELAFLLVSTVKADFCFSGNSCGVSVPYPTEAYFIRVDNCTRNDTGLTIRYTYNINSSVQPQDISVKLTYDRNRPEEITDVHPTSSLLSFSGNFVIQDDISEVNNLKVAYFFDRRFCLDRFAYIQGSCKVKIDECEMLSSFVSTESVVETTSDLSTSSLISLSTRLPSTLPNSNSNLIIIATSIALIILLIAAVMVVWIVTKTRKSKTTIKFQYEKDRKISFTEPPKVRPIKLPPKPIKLFLVFVNDHPKHLNLVKNFIYFLQGDLGFDVICELSQTQECSKDPVDWMDQRFNDSDKILVVWSPGAVERWKKYNQGEKFYQDLFSPVLKQIRNALFHDQNRAKYYFCYFDYFSKDDIPREFSNETSFLLMNRFEDLYYRLNNIEPYMVGGEIKAKRVMLDHYWDPNLNQYGNKLKNSIEEMNFFAKHNPNWYSQSLVPSSSLLSLNLYDEIKERVIAIIPPSPISTVFKSDLNDKHKSISKSHSSSSFDSRIVIYDQSAFNVTEPYSEVESVTMMRGGSASKIPVEHDFESDLSLPENSVESNEKFNSESFNCSDSKIDQRRICNAAFEDKSQMTHKVFTAGIKPENAKFDDSSENTSLVSAFANSDFASMLSPKLKFDPVGVTTTFLADDKNKIRTLSFDRNNSSSTKNNLTDVHTIVDIKKELYDHFESSITAENAELCPIGSNCKGEQVADSGLYLSTISQWNSGFSSPVTISSDPEEISELGAENAELCPIGSNCKGEQVADSGLYLSTISQWNSDFSSPGTISSDPEEISEHRTYPPVQFPNARRYEPEADSTLTRYPLDRSTLASTLVKSDPMSTQKKENSTTYCNSQESNVGLVLAPIDLHSDPMGALVNINLNSLIDD